MLKAQDKPDVLKISSLFIEHLVPLSEADHSHSYLTVRRGALEVAEQQNDQPLITSIADELESVWAKFVTESGGIPERFVEVEDGHVHDDNEACSHADWMLLCLKLHKLTRHSYWLERAILCLEHQFYYNQTINGGFGSRLIQDNLYLQMGKESYWCCSLYGPSVLIEAASYFVEREENTIRIYHPIEGTFKFDDQEVTLSWQDDHYQANLAGAPDITGVDLVDTSWSQWTQTIHQNNYISFAPQWAFWNALPNHSPEPVNVEAGKVYTQFYGPWLLSARSAKGVDCPSLPMTAMHNHQPINELTIRSIRGFAFTNQSVQIAAPSNISINRYDVFAWPNQPENEVLLYPLKDKESPDNMKTWFTARK